jgi:hypothetical protein
MAGIGPRQWQRHPLLRACRKQGRPRSRADGQPRGGRQASRGQLYVILRDQLQGGRQRQKRILEGC